ncbi:hypothetical protein LBMAG47_14260 [Planctomycetia bacterium]|nr:hypothetical protein LBMAG47_14260 [Planctomycetia bacterium]
MQIDPMVSLAHAIHSRPRRYALLLGSGVSRAAGIPTGWEILGELIARVRSLEGADGDDDNVKWFTKRFGEAPDYSRVVERLGQTEWERQEMLRGFFEPAADGRGAHDRKPTAAHRAIARLVKGDFVQVIVTTNFDRLVETALVDEGIHPKVISSEHQVDGIVSLVHEKVVVFKLNGDYRDPSIRNTAGELSKYDPETTLFLNHICESYGLVVCGWSGEWDLALRVALEATKARRFSMFWASRREPVGHALSLVRTREAEVVLGMDADTFFDDLAGKVLSLQEAATAHPRSLQILAAESRRLVRVGEDVPQLQRTVQAVVERARAALVEAVRVEAPKPLPATADWINFSNRQLGEVYAVCMPAARWAVGRQVPILQEVVQRLHEGPAVPSNHVVPEESYWAVPSFLAFHMIGATMAAGRNWPALFEFVAGARVKTRNGFSPYVVGLDWGHVQNHFAEAFGSSGRGPAASRWLFDQWNAVGTGEVPSVQDRDEAFLRFELAIAITHRALTVPPSGMNDRKGVYIRDDTPPWMLSGLYNWRASWGGGERQFVDELQEDQRFTLALQEFVSSLREPVSVQSLYDYLQSWLQRTRQGAG